MSVFCLAMMAMTLDAESIPQTKKTAELKKAVTDILGVRMAKYETSIEEDDELLKTDLPVRKRVAIEVRLGEKRIIKKALDRLDAWDVPPPAKRVKT
jgi:N-lysine methyltransferase SETD6